MTPRYERSYRKLLAALLFGLAISASGQTLTPISQDRHLYVFAVGYVSDSERAAATDFGLFDREVSIWSSHIRASQRSELGVSTITAHGESSLQVYAPHGDVVAARAESVCAVSFAIAEPVVFVLTGQVHASTFASARVGLDSICEATAAPQTTVPFSFIGRLVPGAHDLYSWTEAPFPGGLPYLVQGDFDFQFRLVIPGDLDADCSVDLQDLATQLAHFRVLEGATYADGDVDGDADVDLNDLILLLDNYGRTCP
jgi:hypothetical protein